jgi:hypothetical protein
VRVKSSGEDLNRLRMHCEASHLRFSLVELAATQAYSRTRRDSGQILAMFPKLIIARIAWGSHPCKGQEVAWHVLQRTLVDARH